MLKLTIPEREFWDDEKDEFKIFGERTLELEHSLVSVSKWESTWEVPFLDAKEKTDSQTLDYIRCMISSEDFDPAILLGLSQENIDQVNKYIDRKMTATWFSDQKTKGRSKEIITSELIYYWMISLNIPFECQYWHLNRLLTLVKVCSQKNAPAKKMSKSELVARNRALNEQRKAQLKTSG